MEATVLRPLSLLAALVALALSCWIHEAPAAADRAPPLPEGRAIANLASAQCARLLRSHRVPFEPFTADAPGVRDPVSLTGPLAGVTVEYQGRRRDHAVLDCRLVVALLAWAPVLREAGIAVMRHASVYRAGARVNGSARPSGHAAGLAIDLRQVRLDDGTELDVLEHWVDRARGAAPCEPRPDEPPPGSTLRSVVCRAVEDGLFQTVVTPHHNADHANHVHLELVPEVDWTWVH